MGRSIHRLYLVAVVAVAGGLSMVQAHAATYETAGAIGDSISTGFNASRLGDNKELSWSTGSSSLINSHFQRLKSASGSTTMRAYNEAVAGSVAADLEKQITRILSRSPDYLTITIGANDVCGWTEDYAANLAEFESTLRAALSHLIAARPSIKIFISPIPDVYNLWEIAHQQSGCQTKWNIFGICRPLLGSNRSDLDRQAFVERWRHANDAIAQVATEFADNVLYEPSIAETHFEWDHVSNIDCFHPSAAGQNLLAEKGWILFWSQQQ